MAVGAVEAVGITAEVVGLLDFAAEAVGIMDLVPMVAGPTWVMGGVGTDLLGSKLINFCALRIRS